MASSSDLKRESSFAAEDAISDQTEHVQRAQWLRAAILGASDGLLSTTSLMLGVGAAKDDRRSMILAGLAGAVAGACSMAVGEFVSVSTQRDIEQAGAANLDIIIPSNPITVKTEKMSSPVIIIDPNLPQVSSPAPIRSPMMRVITRDILSTNAVQDHMEKALPNPYKAAAASGFAFLCGSVVPLASAAFVADKVIRIVVIAVVTSIALVALGCLGAHLGGSPVRVSAARVVVGGWIAMGITYGLLKPFDTDHKSRDTD
ncbi:hypothetical protein COLO4_19769 [Corchorus olitorius]|uniref:Vacuolar iron transporter n=1 Tax=Corchorus olitorius TaxID=93759 RepID=A0A1R3J3I4_9ROSI|nr:hypothetical protein COLO4_19769 [Corchorus olitorius]